GRFLYFANANSGIGGGYTFEIVRLDRKSGEFTTLSDRSRSGFRPAVTPDGKSLVFAVEHDGLTQFMVRDLVTGAERRLPGEFTPFGNDAMEQDVIPGYAVTGDGKTLIMSNGGKIVRVDLSTGKSSVIPFHAHVSEQVAASLRHPRRVDDGD